MKFRSIIDEKNTFANVWPKYMNYQEFVDVMNNPKIWLNLKEQLDFVDFINNELK